MVLSKNNGYCNFNPRPPWGGRRTSEPFKHRQNIYFNPRPPWGGRPTQTPYMPAILSISIHALRGEGDALVRGLMDAIPISIHALRGEGDKRELSGLAVDRHFNPRPPWGGRRRPPCNFEKGVIISIHALRGEGDNYFFDYDCSERIISIHALRGEGDSFARPGQTKISLFQSTPSVGRATTYNNKQPRN